MMILTINEYIFLPENEVDDDEVIIGDGDGAVLDNNDGVIIGDGNRAVFDDDDGVIINDGDCNKLIPFLAENEGDDESSQ
jgi:hypothetical protein